MSFVELTSVLVIVVATGVLCYAAFVDFTRYRIPNNAVATLAALFLLHSILVGNWRTMYINIALAIGMFAVLVFFYIRKAIGGGDIKLLTVSFLWVGRELALPFALALLAFAAVQTAAAYYLLIGAKTTGGRIRIAFGPSIAAALITAFVVGVAAQMQDRIGTEHTQRPDTPSVPQSR